MSIFTIADTHLSLTTHKPMDVFGDRWAMHTDKLVARWREVVRDSDTVVIGGDISWAMELEQASADIALLDSLPGRKIIGRGNHDYWWATMKKLTAFKERHAFHTIDFLYNNAYIAEDIVICGSRGWYTDEKIASHDSDYQTVIAREVLRLTMSLEYGRRIDAGAGRELVVFLHFPPVFGDYICDEIIDVLHAYNITLCFFGHIHAQYNIPQVRVYQDIEFVLTSADYLNFTPLRIN